MNTCNLLVFQTSMVSTGDSTPIHGIESPVETKSFWWWDRLTQPVGLSYLESLLQSSWPWREASSIPPNASGMLDTFMGNSFISPPFLRKVIHSTYLCASRFDWCKGFSRWTPLQTTRTLVQSDLCNTTRVCTLGCLNSPLWGSGEPAHKVFT